MKNLKKNLVKNSELIKRCFIIALATALAIISLIGFFLSYQKYNDGYGTDISFDMDAIVLFICSLAILIYGVYSVYALKKDKSLKTAYYASFGTVSVLIAFYPLGMFFKALAKGKKFEDYQDYLYIGIIGILMIFYLIFSYISDNKKN